MNLNETVTARFPADSAELALGLRLVGLIDTADTTADATRAASELAKLLARFPLPPPPPPDDPLTQHLREFGPEQ